MFSSCEKSRNLFYGSVHVCSGSPGGLMVSVLDSGSRKLHCVLAQDPLLSYYLSPPWCINEYQ